MGQPYCAVAYRILTWHFAPSTWSPFLDHVIFESARAKSAACEHFFVGVRSSSGQHPFSVRKTSDSPSFPYNERIIYRVFFWMKIVFLFRVFFLFSVVFSADLLKYDGITQLGTLRECVGNERTLAHANVPLPQGQQCWSTRMKV